MLKDLSIGISAKMSFRPGKDLSGISAKMSFRPGKKPNAKDAIKPPKLKTQTLSFHPKIENDALPVSVSECNRIIAVNKFDLAAGLEVGDRIVAVDGVELVGPLEYSPLCKDKRGCEATVERLEDRAHERMEQSRVAGRGAHVVHDRPGAVGTD